MEVKQNFSDADRFYLKSLCSYYEGNLLNALTQLKEGLAVDPIHRKAKMMHSKLEQQNRTKTDGTFYFRNIQKLSKATYNFQATNYFRYKNSAKPLTITRRHWTWNISTMDLCLNCYAVVRRPNQKLEISAKQSMTVTEHWFYTHWI